MRFQMWHMPTIIQEQGLGIRADTRTNILYLLRHPILITSPLYNQCGAADLPEPGRQVDRKSVV